MTEAFIEESQRLLRIAKADLAACSALLNPYAVVFRYDDIETELLSGVELTAVVTTMVEWGERELGIDAIAR